MAASFKSFSKKIGNAAKNTAKKSEELIEIGKQNHKISGEKEKINKTIFEIGNMVLENYNNGADEKPEYVEKCTAIEEYKNNIIELEEKIMELKHIKICPECNKEVADDIMFCSSCGHKFEAKVEVVEADPDAVLCPHCNEDIEDGISFCPKCGGKV